jgi:hypothetical protein
VPEFSGLRLYTFPGGCIAYEFHFLPEASPSLATPPADAVQFEPRTGLVDYIRSTEGLALCGRVSPCPG